MSHPSDGVFLLGSVMWIYSVNMEAFALMDRGEPTVPADRASPETGELLQTSAQAD